MNTKFDQDLPMKLKLLRLDAGLSQEEFAARAGISRSCVANYETGKRRPDIQMIRAFAKIYGVVTDVLIGSNQQPRVSMRENSGDSNKKSSHQRKTLDISHFPTENQISMLEYYEYIKSRYGKEENSTPNKKRSVRQ